MPPGEAAIDRINKWMSKFISGMCTLWICMEVSQNLPEAAAVNNHQSLFGPVQVDNQSALPRFSANISEPPCFPFSFWPRSRPQLRLLQELLFFFWFPPSLHRRDTVSCVYCIFMSHLGTLPRCIIVVENRNVRFLLYFEWIISFELQVLIFSFFPSYFAH